MTIDELSARLERVEKQNRRLRAAGTAVVVLGVAFAAIGQASPPAKVLRAEEFELVDGAGKTRGWMGVHSNGRAEFWLASGSETGPNATISVTAEGRASMGVASSDRGMSTQLTAQADGSFSGVEMKDEGTRLRGYMGILNGGAPRLVLIDKDAKGCIDLFVPPEGAPAMTLKGHNGAVLDSLPRGPAATDNPVIRARLVEIVDDKGVVRANLGMTPGGDETGKIRPALTLFSETGTSEQVTLGVTRTGVPLLNMANGELGSALQIQGSGARRGLIVWGKDQASVHVGTGPDDKPTITMMDSHGKVEFTAPK